MNAAARRQRAVAQGFVPQAAGCGALGEALEWLGVVGLVAERLPSGWERARGCWQARRSAPDGRRESSCVRLGDVRARERWP